MKLEERLSDVGIKTLSCASTVIIGSWVSDVENKKFYVGSQKLEVSNLK